MPTWGRIDMTGKCAKMWNKKTELLHHQWPTKGCGAIQHHQYGLVSKQLLLRYVGMSIAE